jgi:uncharacterized membrane protein YgcG
MTRLSQSNYMTRRELAEMMLFFMCVLFTSLCIPSTYACITDTAQVFTAEQTQILTEFCNQIYEHTSIVFWVYTINDTIYDASNDTSNDTIDESHYNSQDIATSAVSFFDKHKLGDESTDSGFLVVLNPQKKQYYLLPGYGIDSHISAGMLGRFSRDVFEPAFDQGSYYLAVLHTMEFVVTVVDDSLLTPPRIWWWAIIVGICSVCLTAIVYIKYRVWIPLIILDIYTKRGGKSSGGGLGKQ